MPSAQRSTGSGSRPALLYLGIEAGGTHTVAIAAGAPLDAPVRREFGQANLWLLDDAQLARRFRAIARAMPRADSVAIGMSGARTDEDRARVRAAASQAWPAAPCYVTNDLETALMAAPTVTRTASRAGARRRRTVEVRVAIVSGTGSCCFGRGADGRTARVGGWGHVLGDRGSGYDIVARALREVVWTSDRSGWPPLGDRLLRALSLAEPHDLVGWIQGASKSEVAALAVEIFDAAGRRDRIAAGVLDATAETLAADAVECARKVARRGTPVQFVLAGSVLLKQPRFAARVGRGVRRLWPDAVLTPVARESAWGAVELARAHASDPWPGGARRRPAPHSMRPKDDHR